jgi:hypothetical protein
VTVERHAPRREKRPFQATIIPFRGAETLRLHEAPAAFAPAAVLQTRTLRPVDVLLLLPIIAPVTVMVLLALLGWFVCWLAIVGLLVAAIVVADIVRAVLWRMYPPTSRGLDHRAVSYQGP